MKGTILATGLALTAIAASWTSGLDTVARDHARSALRNALVAYASARALNAGISVAQGSELALSPAGVGVTMTLGEVLDPVNDLVERFSWVVLVAAASLGAQILLSEMFSATWTNVAVTLIAVGYLVCVWVRPHWQWVHRVAVATLFVRFALPLTMVLSTAIGSPILDPRKSEAMEAIAITNDAIALDAPPVTEGSAPGALDRLRRLIDDTRERIDVEAWVGDLRARAEEAIEHLVDLITLFAVQTIVLPILSLLLVYFATRQIWRQL